MSEMKSAREKAMEKVEKLGKLTEDEVKRFECVPVGNKLASTYLQDADFNLDAKLTKYKGTGLRKYIANGAQEIFLHKKIPPQSEKDNQATKRAMSGLRIAKENKNQLETILDRITNLLNYYEQARQQTYSQFKKGFEAKLQETSQIGIAKENKNQLETILDRITNLLNYYEQARQQTYSQFKKGFEAKLQETSQALQKQPGNTVPIEVQLQAQFQTEWHKLSSQLNAQYEKVLEEHKQQIQKIG